MVYVVKAEVTKDHRSVELIRYAIHAKGHIEAYEYVKRVLEDIGWSVVNLSYHAVQYVNLMKE